MHLYYTQEIVPGHVGNERLDRKKSEITEGKCQRSN